MSKSASVFYVKREFFRDSMFITAENVDPTQYEFKTTFDAGDCEDVFRRMNVVTGDQEYEIPLRLKCRSMCVGDVVLFGEEWFLTAFCGFTKLADDASKKMEKGLRSNPGEEAWKEWRKCHPAKMDLLEVD